jgi:hypothetical protein
MTDEPRQPLVPPEVDLRDFPYFPIYRAQFFGSQFHAICNDTEWRAGLTLWVKSWDQVPAGTLPNDDIALARLAELGRDVETWKSVKTNALRGWHLCTDGRLHHAVLAGVVLEAWAKRKKASTRGKAGAAARWKEVPENGASNAYAIKNGASNAPTKEIDGASNAHAMEQASKPIAQAMLVDGKRREGKGREEEDSVSPEVGETDPAEKAGSSNSQNGAKAPSPDDRTWCFNEGLEWVAKAQGRSPKFIRSTMGKWLKDCGDDDKLLRRVIEEAAKLTPANPVSWITAAIATRIGYVPEADAGPSIVQAYEREWRPRIDHYKRTGRWQAGIGPKPGEAGCGAPAYLLKEFGF